MHNSNINKSIQIFIHLENSFYCLTAIVFCAYAKDPPVVKTIPKYVNLLTISIIESLYIKMQFSGNLPPLLKIITLVLVVIKEATERLSVSYPII
jgi:hypothetical protein